MSAAPARPSVRATPARRRLLALLLAGAAGCGHGNPAAPAAGPPRPFAMGFTDFPYAPTLSAVEAVLEILRRDADLVVLHFDDGVPWEEAAAARAYPAAYQADLERRARSQPEGHVRYLALTPLNFQRDGLAARRGDGGSEPLRPPWDRRRLDDPETIEAYLAHCERMIAIFKPDYLAYGIEVNMLAETRPDRWPALVRLVSALYPRLKARHPTLPVFLSFQVDLYQARPGPQAAAIREVLAYSDLVGMSSYPYTRQGDPRALPADHFRALAGLAPGKRVAIAETGWPGEAVTAPYPAFIPASEDTQRSYVEWLLGQADSLDAAFVNWFLARDYDEWWQTALRHQGDAPLLRLWRDIGLYRGDGTPRPARDAWRGWLERPRR